MSAQTYQVGAHFAALIEEILMAPLKTIERFFLHFEFPCRTVKMMLKGAQKPQPLLDSGGHHSGQARCGGPPGLPSSSVVEVRSGATASRPDTFHEKLAGGSTTTAAAPPPPNNEFVNDEFTQIASRNHM